MKERITINLQDQDDVEVEATIVAGVMAVHTQPWVVGDDSDSTMWVVSHVHTGMTFGIYALDSEQDALEAAGLAALSEAVIDVLSATTAEEAISRTGENFHTTIQKINQVFVDRQRIEAKAEYDRLIESGEIMSPSALEADIRDNGWSGVDHFDDVLELVEDASDKQKQAIVDAFLAHDAAKNGDVQTHDGYAEPGYDDPEYLVLIANWNGYSDGNELEKLLETCGCSIEWSDEWIACGECWKLARTSPDYYGWTPSYVLFHGCEPVCHECMSADEGMQRDYVEQELEDNCDKADTLGLDLEGLDYTRLDEDFQSGLYGGQCADPHKIGAALRERGIERFVFQVDSVGQFDSRFSCWIHNDDMPEGGLELDSTETDGPDPAQRMKAALQDASAKMSGLSGEGVKVATCNADGTADVRLVSKDDFIAGNGNEKGQ